MFPWRDQVHLCAQWAPSCSSGLWVDVNVFMWLKDHWGSQVIVFPLNCVHRQKASFSVTCSHRPRCQYEKHSLHFAFERLATCHVFLWRASSRRAQNLILLELLLDWLSLPWLSVAHCVQRGAHTSCYISAGNTSYCRLRCLSLKYQKLFHSVCPLKPLTCGHLYAVALIGEHMVQEHNTQAPSFSRRLKNCQSVKTFMLHAKWNVLCMTIITGIYSDKYSCRSNASTSDVIFYNFPNFL